MSNNIYNINYTNLGRWLTPKYLRKPKMLAVVKIILIPFVFIYQDFLRYRIQKLYQLMITPQKCYLERLLNDRYDFTLRRIYIDDGVDKPPRYIYINAELKPLYIRRRSEGMPVTIYTAGESGTFTNDFIVYVPLDIALELAEIISLIKIYKLVGTKFKIQRV